MWYINIAGRFFGLVTKHACDRETDGQMDRITTPTTALAQLRRAVKTRAFSPPFCAPLAQGAKILTRDI